MVVGSVLSSLLYGKAKPICDHDLRLKSQFKEFIACSKGERNLRLAGIVGIATVTWFHGGDDVDTVRDFFRQRIRQVITANPWIAGRLVIYQGAEHIAYNNTIDVEVLALDKALKECCFEQVPPVPLSSDSTAEEVDAYIHSSRPSYIVNSTHYTEPLLRLVLIEPTEKANKQGEFGVLLSMAHIAVDGFAFYRFYKMIMDPSIPIVSMNPSRVGDIFEIRKRVMGERHTNIQINLGALWHFALFKLFTRKRTWKAQHYLLDTEKIKELKQLVNPERDGVPFVSTNDIVSSWILSKSKCAFARIATNLRGKVPELEESLSANYISAYFVQCPEEVSTPAHVRKVVDSIPRPDSLFPSDYATLFRGPQLLYSNWATLIGTDKLEPPDCREIKHDPLGGSRQGAFPSGGVVYVHRYCQGETAVVIHYSSENAPEVPPFARPLSISDKLT